MPRTSSLGGSGAAEAFWTLLDEALRTREMAKRAALRAIGRGPSVSTEHLNRYRRVLPTVKVVRKLARALGIAERRALLVAGYLRELLPEVADLVAAGKRQCAEDGLNPETCMMPVRRRRSFMVQNDRYMFATVPSGEGPEFYVPWTTVSGVYIAIAGFPRRGEVHKVETLLSIAAGPNEGCVRGKPGRNARELTIATQVLGCSELPVEDRRACAAELVRSWVHRECGEFARAVESVTYEQSTEPVVPPLLGAEKGV